MVAVTKANIYSGIWQNIFSVIHSSVTDPRGRTKWIYSSFPEIKNESKEDYPILIIEKVSTPGYTRLSDVVKESLHSITIGVYTTNSEQLDTLFDSVFSTMEGAQSTFDDCGLHDMNVTSTSDDFFERSGFRVHYREITYRFAFGIS